jgi:uncharacterized protein YjbI with pentapeptide repeats
MSSRARTLTDRRNKWRGEHPQVRRKLNGAEALVPGVNLTGANLVSADFRDAIIRHTVFGTVDLSAVRGLEGEA